MLRVLFVEEAPSVGGSIFSLLQLARGLDGSRFTPFVLFRYDLPARRAYDDAGIRHATWAEVTGEREATPPATGRPNVPRYKRGSFPLFLSSTKRYVRIQRPESERIASWIAKEAFSLVHTNNSVTANLSFLDAARRTGIPAVSHQRGYFRLTPLHRLIVRRVDRFLCVSRSVSEHYIRQGLPESKVMTVYNGITMERSAPDRRSTGSDTFVAGWFGRLERWKGADMLLDAARIVLGSRTDIRFVLAGTGTDETRLRQAVSDDPLLRDHVTMLGYRDDSIEVLRTCDLAISTSIEPEPLSRSALEAIAAGVPLIASRCGGNPEIIEDGSSGLLYEPGNPAQLADRIAAVLEDGQLRSRLAAEGRLRAERIFNAQRYVSEVESVYSEILAR